MIHWGLLIAIAFVCNELSFHVHVGYAFCFTERVYLIAVNGHSKKKELKKKSSKETKGKEFKKQVSKE